MKAPSLILPFHLHNDSSPIQLLSCVYILETSFYFLNDSLKET
jgi:hypothetical protein